MKTIKLDAETRERLWRQSKRVKQYNQMLEELLEVLVEKRVEVEEVENDFWKDVYTLAGFDSTFDADLKVNWITGEIIVNDDTEETKG